MADAKNEVERGVISDDDECSFCNRTAGEVPFMLAAKEGVDARICCICISEATTITFAHTFGIVKMLRSELAKLKGSVSSASPKKDKVKLKGKAKGKKR